MMESSKNTRSPGIGNLVLLFGSFHRGQQRLDEAICKLKTNRACTYKPLPFLVEEKWKGNLPNGIISTLSSMFCFSFSEMPKDKKAWVFGCSGEETHHINDFWLAEDNNQGISKHHFAIDLVNNDTKNMAVPRIVLVSTTLWLKVEHEGVVVTLRKPGHSYEITGSIKLTFPNRLSFWVWTPERDSRQARDFTKKANQFVENLKRELPDHLASIDNGPDTTLDDYRVGRDESTYTQHRGYNYATGSSASVFRVLKNGKDVQLVAKELFYKERDSAITVRSAAEEIENQFKMGTKVLHVSQPTCLPSSLIPTQPLLSPGH